MATKTWYLTSSLVSVHQEMSESDPGTEAFASPVYGFITGTVAATNYAAADAQTEVAAASFGATAQPDGTINTGAGAGDCWRTTNTYSGSFASANWTVNMCIRANTTAGGTSRGRCRLFRSANADGSGATEITGAAQVGSTVTPATGSTTNSSVTFNPGSFRVTNEYVFVQIGWETVTQGGMTSNDENFRVGNSASLGSRVVSADFTPDTSITPGVGSLTTSGNASVLAFGMPISVGSLTTTGFAPTVQEGSGVVNTNITPSDGSLTISGNAPTIVLGYPFTPGVGSLTTSGFAPTLTESDHRTFVPSVGTLAFTGNTFAQDIAIRPDTA